VVNVSLGNITKIVKKPDDLLVVNKNKVDWIVEYGQKIAVRMFL